MSTLTASVLMSYIPGTDSNKYFNEMSSSEIDTDMSEEVTTTVAPVTQTDDKDDIDDTVDAAATRRSLKTNQAPIAKGEDDTDLDPTKMLKELSELSLKSSKSISQKELMVRNLNNNVPAPAPTNPRTTYTQSKYVYNMQHKHRGRAVIINNINFQKITGMSKRGGSQKDADSLVVTLDRLGFNVESHTDLTIKKTRAVVNNMSKKDHTNADCVLFVIMTHGEEGVLYCVDGKIAVDEVTAPFRGDKCPSLAGKPKIFFIQACRGQKLDSGVEVVGVEETDAVYGYPGEERQLIPAEADFLIGYSSPPGYYSWRNQGIGAWFIQAILSVLHDHGTEMEIQQMMTRVSHIVAYEYMSNCSIPGFDQKKQVPCIVSTLTKELYFRPKHKSTDL